MVWNQFDRLIKENSEKIKTKEACNQSPKDRGKESIKIQLKALLEQFEVRDIETALFLTEHLADYILTPEISSPQEAALDQLLSLIHIYELNRQPFRFFLSAAHRERWTHWKNRCYVMSERNAAALFLLTADEELWQRVLWHFDSSGFDFPAIRLSGIHPELYSIYQAAKTISVGGDNIVIEDLAFSELVSDRAFRLILGALLLCRYGEVVLNLERKTEEIT